MACRTDHMQWTLALVNKALDLRVNWGKSWKEVAHILALPSEAAPRTKVGHVLRAGGSAPEKGSVTYTMPEVVAGAPVPDVKLTFSVPENPRTVRMRVDPANDTPQVIEPVVSPEVAEQLPYELHGTMVVAKYKFDGAEYSFPVNDDVVSIPRQVWADIVADYSQHGGNLTQHEIALKVGMNKGVLTACLNKYGAYKASSPILREELAETPDAAFEPLYDRAIEVKEARFLRGLERHKLATLETANQSLRAQLSEREGEDARARALLREVIAEFPVAAPLERLDFGQAAVGAEEVHACVFDGHFGARIDGDEEGWGGHFTSDTAAEYLVHYADRIALAVSARPARCAAVHLTFGGDLFHAFDQHTKNGTLLERDKYDRLVWRIAFTAATRAIARLTEVADRVVVRVIRGNHDGIYSELFEEQLAAFYRAEPRVAVPNELGKRKAWLIGDTLHVVDHGEGFERFGPQQLLNAETVARMVGGPKFHRARKVYLYVGHTHHRETVALNKKHGGHLEIIRVPTWAHTSDYEERLMHAGEPEGTFYFIDARGRIRGEERVYFADLQAV